VSLSSVNLKRRASMMPSNSFVTQIVKVLRIKFLGRTRVSVYLSPLLCRWVA